MIADSGSIQLERPTCGLKGEQLMQVGPQDKQANDEPVEDETEIEQDEGDEEVVNEGELTAEQAYEDARQLVEMALDAYTDGDSEEGDRLIEAATALDPDAVEDVYEELEEDAASEHDPEKLKRDLEDDDNG